MSSNFPRKQKDDFLLLLLPLRTGDAPPGDEAQLPLERGVRRERGVRVRAGPLLRRRLPPRQLQRAVPGGRRLGRAGFVEAMRAAGE